MNMNMHAYAQGQPMDQRFTPMPGPMQQPWAAYPPGSFSPYHMGPRGFDMFSGGFMDGTWFYKKGKKHKVYSTLQCSNYVAVVE